MLQTSFTQVLMIKANLHASLYHAPVTYNFCEQD